MPSKKKAKGARKAPAKKAKAPRKATAKPKTTAAKATAKPKVTSTGDGATVAAAWERLEGWFARHEPSLALKLRPGASEKEIGAAEKALGVKFPEDFRASLRVHDGQDDDPGVRLFPSGQRLGSLASLTRCWKDDRALFDDKEMAERFDWLDEDRRVRQVHLHPMHIPIAGSRFWDYGRLLLDYIPGPSGVVGQVIARVDVDHEYVCASFGELLARTARGLEDGSIVVRAASYDSGLVYLSRKGGKELPPGKYFG